ncbi:hypothetical protein DIC66_19525 [Rhodoferax lacus]|uniref:Uncharacterized protein n=1 Tax=Rhodoferax lacus TaxID=2184758 RepID=A0A3E1R772_9BURK|nr:hypothetical protein [Rhodoferax lacus]RFO95204.1 hypothetical protein DIC66_19525 [Rhodoferax lacus]
MEVLLQWLFEILATMLSSLFEVFAEAVLQIVAEALAEAGIHLTRGEVEHPESRSKWRLMLGYALLGSIAGGLSLLVFSHSLTHSHAGRLATLLLAPMAAAATTVAIGRWRARRGQETVDMDRLAYAYLFALGMAVVRFHWAA